MTRRYSNITLTCRCGLRITGLPSTESAVRVIDAHAAHCPHTPATDDTPDTLLGVVEVHDPAGDDR